MRQPLIKYPLAWLKKCRMPLAILIIILAIVFSTFRALTPWAKQYKGDVEHHLSTILGQPVTIHDLETSWYWFEPVLKMDKVRLSDNQDHVLELNKLLVGIDLISSLWHWQIKPGVLYVDDVHVTLRQVHNQWEVDGLSQTKQVMKFEPTSYFPVLSWLLAQEKIIIKNVSATVYLRDGTVIPFDGVHFTAIQSYGHYRVNGRAKLAQTIATELTVIADLQLDASALGKARGHAYVSLQHVLPTQWQGFFPKTAYHVQGGEGSVNVWLDLVNGHFSTVQSTMHGHDITWTQDGKPKARHVPLFDANVAWKKASDGWVLTADHIALKTGRVHWANNAVRLEYKKTPNVYAAFVKKLTLESVLETDMVADVAWPDNVRSMLAMHPRGALYDTQMVLKDNQLDYLLTRFAQFGWQAQQDIPEVQKISGVFYWQPTEGRLDLDGENTVIAPHGLPPLTFGLFNAAFDWKQLNNGMRISMDRFVLSHPRLLLSARGALDNPQSLAESELRLTADFSANDAKPLLAYIPARYLKPKLNQWLKHDVKRIAKASGRLVVKGALADFPFDTPAANKPQGEFSIHSHVSGVDLLITKHWPINRNIDADLRVDQRTLEADIFQANLQGVDIDKINLVINGIGLGREALLIHGNVTAPADKIKSYVFASPLRTRLALLKRLDVEDSLGLDLQLDIPLYPESDEVLARGAVVFDNNQAMLHSDLHDLVLDDISGTLQFDEHGLTDGRVQGLLAGDPVAMQVQSFLAPKPYTAVTVAGSTTVDLLKKTIALPLFAFMEGRLNIESVFTLYNNPHDLDHMHIETSLVGVAIDLPSPIGKPSVEPRPLRLDAAFNPEKSVQLHVQYADRLSGELLFVHAKDSFLLDRGELRLGEGAAVLPSTADVHVVGSFPEFDGQQWRRALSRLPVDGSISPFMSRVQVVDLTLGNLQIFKEKFSDLHITARKLNKNDWSVRLNQKNIVADLHYQPSTNLVSGHFEHVFLGKLEVNKRVVAPAKISLHPMDIPNLNVTIDTLKLGEVEVGDVTLKTASTPAHFIVNQCLIKSSDYQLSVQGDWAQNGTRNNTTMQADLQIDDLGKSLERWHMTPAVNARQGDIRFNGGWAGAFSDFSLATVAGDMQITLKNGRISHLSPETEEKLGLGKLLSILSLQTIPRRLQLDFSDLSQQGYSFDVFKGHFKLHEGIMTTGDSYIDGPVAYASMKGDLDLCKRLYDVDLRVTPYITASLPIVATIAGGPIAGIATWLASKIINKGMQEISGYTYKVSGPWLEPIVQQVNIYRKNKGGASTSSGAISKPIPATL